MAIRAKYCTQCGGAIAHRDVEGRERIVCPACERILYENPLPVAASLVLNERREVLLVKRARAPYVGQWCLPMGFAEVGETISQAALRELHEETGVEGRVIRLLDADSTVSEKYGDLLIVTFEVRKTGGEERATAESTETRYFPLGYHPPLAFSSNEKALRACAQAHLEGWAIQDSFASLQGKDDRALLADDLVEQIERSADEIAEHWLVEILADSALASYRRMESQQLVARATLAVSQFSRWFKAPDAEDEMRLFYRSLARDRRAAGFPASQVVASTLLLKQHVWAFVRQRADRTRAIDSYRALEVNRLMSVFFDRACVHILRGFEAES